MTATTPHGDDGIDNILKKFGMNNPFVYVTGCFRSEIQVLTLNVTNLLTSQACRTEKAVLINGVIPNVKMLHEFAIAAGGGILVLVSSAAGAHLFKEEYSKHCDDSCIGTLLGTRKMHIEDILTTVNDCK